jgi:hypothetical protein
MVSWPQDGFPSAVYNPPVAGYPYLAVIFGPDGEVLASRAWPTKADAASFVVEAMSFVAAQPGMTLTLPE